MPNFDYVDSQGWKILLGKVSLAMQIALSIPGGNLECFNCWNCYSFNFVIKRTNNRHLNVSKTCHLCFNKSGSLLVGSLLMGTGRYYEYIDDNFAFRSQQSYL